MSERGLDAWLVLTNLSAVRVKTFYPLERESVYVIMTWPPINMVLGRVWNTNLHYILYAHTHMIATEIYKAEKQEDLCSISALNC